MLEAHKASLEEVREEMIVEKRGYEKRRSSTNRLDQKQVDLISDDELETADNDEEWKDCGTNGKSCKSKISENSETQPSRIETVKRLKKEFEGFPSIIIVNHKVFSCTECKSTNILYKAQAITRHLQSQTHLKNTGAEITEAEKMKIVAAFAIKYEARGITFPDHSTYYCNFCKITRKVDLRGINVDAHLRCSQHKKELAKLKRTESQQIEKKSLRNLFKIET